MAGWRTEKLQGFCYGGDYNPEQWPEEVWLEDMRLMKKAGVNLVSVGIFSWAVLQPGADNYDFAWLDRLMDLLAKHGIYADLATATASPPAWMAVNHPDTLPVDKRGSRYRHGSRQHYCPNSHVYRDYAARLVRRLAERYKDHPGLAMWHVNNEYGCHISECYCSSCEHAFRVWLEKRYGTIDELNARWGTNFWSQKYYRWDEIGLPAHTPTFANPGQQLDYRRFMSDSLLDCYLNEANILREVTPGVPVMTNFMGSFKPLDYFKWAQHIDVVNWDSYPEPTSGTGQEYAALNHDLLRSMKGGQPFLLMEQVTSQVNWRQHNPLKRPGVMRLWSLQTVARGGDGVLFFQWRQSRAGAEKFHGAMVSHMGDEHSRVYREVEQLGGDLQRIEEIADARITAKVAIVFDYDNWWALELDSKPSADVRYMKSIETYHRALYRANIAVDFVTPEQDLSAYALVIAPTLYMVKPGVQDNLERYVSTGGSLVLTYFSGMVDENDRIHLGEYPAPFRKLLGLCVEEFDPMLPEQRNRIKTADGGSYECSLWADIIRLDGAEAIAHFESDFYAGGAAVTRHSFGQGKAYYVGTQPNDVYVAKLLGTLCEEAGIVPPIAAPAGVEVSVREHADGRAYVFVLNHNAEPVRVELPPGEYANVLDGSAKQGEIELPVAGVAILKRNAE
ncbi:beta-galactosidase [Paenibacillus turpanensis]|uniref:beta-galactosidase n=1 Tax=Paenibacillus turpanensis TaxID=2689078 RepID=UPI001409604A|nr:beta-galactosidase [Paenibacillus turpanensis]